MILSRKLSLLTVGLMLLTGCQQQPSEPVQITAGHELFLTHCAGCHMGTGDPPGPNAVVAQSVYLQSEEAFVRFLRKPTSPMMPPFDEHQLPDEAARELYDYLQKQAHSGQ